MHQKDAIHTDELDENQIIEKSKSNPREFEPLYNKYFKPIYLYLLKRVANETVAKDLSSQTFVKALMKLNQYSSQGKTLLPWLFRIAGNELLLYYRSNKITRNVHAGVASISELSTELHIDFDESSDDEKLAAVLGNLAEDELQIIEMKYLELRPYEEIAEVLQISVSNAKVKVHRIMKKLKEIAKDENY